MSVTLKIPAALRTITKSDSVVVEASDLKGAIMALNQKHPGMAELVCNERGLPRPHVLIYVDKTDIRELNGMDTALKGGEEIHIIAAVSGG